MAASPHSPNDLMIRKLESIVNLSHEEKQALNDLPVQTVDFKTNKDIVSIGDRPSRCCLILKGFTCVYKLTSDGKRQIMALHVPGDIPDLQSLHLEVMDISIAPISPCTIGFIPHENVRYVCERHPRLTAAFWRETLVDASVYRDWLLNIGQREAEPRVAHLFCELLTRLNAVGLVEDGTFDLPITQTELADAIGVSPVHMNRVLKTLRGGGLIQIKGLRMTIPDWEAMKEVGDFDALYLHLKDEVVETR